ncbi:hypothetical protein M406DRAFT_326643 [Cryphonectria parasitica EP155]|uniref:Uncharacterized protein n=1 Tax=Cryphonectria parasitica (strain ATCC 38755 / EP155) TaxID=660469 RepID=A0A9P4YFC1_CRYP1|nr:uncharacterized protein M406DRAFT_326643 [Cryphonectria parasitica EP155]KAF3771255.1 hypothetical protein M406DRAFT_326643 [Cryphonectria parasitica EP155]
MDRFHHSDALLPLTCCYGTHVPVDRCSKHGSRDLGNLGRFSKTDKLLLGVLPAGLCTVIMRLPDRTLDDSEHSKIFQNLWSRGVRMNRLQNMGFDRGSVYQIKIQKHGSGPGTHKPVTCQTHQCNLQQGHHRVLWTIEVLAAAEQAYCPGFVTCQLPEQSREAPRAWFTQPQVTPKYGNTLARLEILRRDALGLFAWDLIIEEEEEKGRLSLWIPRARKREPLQLDTEISEIGKRELQYSSMRRRSSRGE